MATINNIDGFVHTIADTPPWREAVQAHQLGQERPNRFAEFSNSPRRKTGWSTNAWKGWKQPGTNPTSGSTGWTAVPETSKATTTNEGSATGSWPSPSPQLDSNLH